MEYKPGPEMDALIAEKVFGLVLRDRFTGEERPMSASQVLANHQIKTSIPKFSTDIAAAWEIVERFRYKNGLEGFYLCEDHSEFRCNFDPDIDKNSALAASAPEAICRAALKYIDKN